MDRRQRYEDNHRQQHIAVIVIDISHSDRFLHPAVPVKSCVVTPVDFPRRGLYCGPLLSLFYMNIEKTNYVNYNKDCMY